MKSLNIDGFLKFDCGGLFFVFSLVWCLLLILIAFKLKHRHSSKTLLDITAYLPCQDDFMSAVYVARSSISLEMVAMIQLYQT